ncbi:MAG: hypothetical protein AB1938_11000 [Myxococcota bacterium]
MALVLALLLAASPDAGTPPSALQEIQRLAKKLEPTVKSPWVKKWLGAAQELPPVAPRKFWCTKDKSECWAQKPQRETRELVERTADEEYFYARVADPLGYTRAFELLAAAGFQPKGKKVLDLGYGNIGQLAMLARLGADVHGIEVDAMLPLAYEKTVGPVTARDGTKGKLAVHHGFFAKDPKLVAEVGAGYALFLSKNTLKRGYVHPSQPVPENQRIDLGSDEAFLKAVHDLLEPGGYFLIYNLSPAPAKPGQPYKQMAEGECPFSRQSIEKAGFEVIAFDATDDGPARAMGKVLEWDADPESPWDLETDLFSHYTLARRK